MVDKYLTVNLTSLATLWILDMSPCCLHNPAMQPCNLRFPVAPSLRKTCRLQTNRRFLHLGRPKKGGPNGPFVPGLFAAGLAGFCRTARGRSTSRGQNLMAGSWFNSGDVVEVNWDDVWWPCDIIEVSSHLKLDKLPFFLGFIFLWGKKLQSLGTLIIYVGLALAMETLLWGSFTTACFILLTPFFHPFSPYHMNEHHQLSSPKVHGEQCTVKYHDGGDVEESVEVADRVRKPRPRKVPMTVFDDRLTERCLTQWRDLQ